MLNIAATVSLLAVGAQAFLLPPTVSSNDNEIINTLPFEHVAESDERIIDVSCPGCPVLATDLIGNPHELRIDNELRLNFSISHEGEDRLELNGIALYPLGSFDFRTESLTAPQIVHIGKDASVAGYPKLGYQVSVEHTRPKSDEDNLSLLNVQLDIVEVGDAFIRGIDSVEIKLLKTPSDKLMIGDINVVPAQSIISAPSGEDECTTPMCRWQATLADKLSKIKGCAGMAAKMGHGRPPKHHGSRPRPHTKGAHGPHPHHRHHHHRHGGIISFMKMVSFHVLVPIAVGVMAGIAASIVGMIAGQLVVFVWRTLFRRGRRGPDVRLSENEASETVDEESKALVDHQGPPPVYEDAPAYKDAVDEKETV